MFRFCLFAVLLLFTCILQSVSGSRMAKRGLASKVMVSTLDTFSDMRIGYIYRYCIQIYSVTEREAKTCLMSLGVKPHLQRANANDNNNTSYNKSNILNKFYNLVASNYFDLAGSYSGRGFENTL